MGAPFGNDAVVQYKNLVCILNGGQAVGDDEGRTAYHELVQRILYHLFAFRIQGRGGLVKDEDFRVLQDGPGNGDTLALASGKNQSPVPHLRINAIRQFPDEFFRIGGTDGSPHLFVGGIQAAVEHIVLNGCIKEECVLGHQTDLVAKGAQLRLPNIHAVDIYFTAGDFIEPGEQVGYGGFTGTGGPYDGNGFTGIGFEIEIRQDRMPFFVGKLYMLCLHQTILHHQRLFVFMVLVLFFFVKNGKNPVRCRQGLLDIAVAVGNTLDGVCQVDGINEESDEFAGGHNAVDNRYAAVPDNDRNGQGRQEFHHRRELALLADGPHRGLEIVLVHLFEPFRFIITAVEASNNADAGNGFLQHGRHVGQPFLHAPAGGMELPAEELDGHRHQGHNDQAENGELPLEINHGGKGADENGPFLHQHDEIGGHGSLQGTDVVGEITHDFAGAPFIKVSDRQLLQMLVKFVPQIPNHRLPDVPHEIAVGKGGGTADKEHHNNGNNNQIKHGEVFIFQDLINDVLDNPGNVKVGCRYRHHTDDGNNQQLDIGLQKFEKPFITV